ncbi:hypothetical protein TNCV_2327291 [Trichonephila clavipes]|nr:hypothetical protein TNCV_2327291 [Trichonephila clavipes]
MNRLYPNSRRESGNENQYLNTLPAEEDGEAARRKRYKHVTRGRSGGAQGRGSENSPKNAYEEHQTQSE